MIRRTALGLLLIGMILALPLPARAQEAVLSGGVTDAIVTRSALEEIAERERGERGIAPGTPSRDDGALRHRK